MTEILNAREWCENRSNILLWKPVSLGGAEYGMMAAANPLVTLCNGENPTACSCDDNNDSVLNVDCSEIYLASDDADPSVFANGDSITGPVSVALPLS